MVVVKTDVMVVEDGEPPLGWIVSMHLEVMVRVVVVERERPATVRVVVGGRIVVVEM